MVLDITNPFFATIEQSAEIAAWEQGYNLVLFNIGSNMERQEAGFQFFRDTQVDAVVVCSSYLPDEKLFPLLASFNAVVLLNHVASPDIASTIHVDNRTGMLTAVSYLAERGRRQIAYLGGPEISQVNRERTAGYQQALEQAGLPARSELIRNVTFGKPWRDGYHLTNDLLDQYPEIDAIQCYNDLIASGALSAVMERGLTVPDDIAIIGCDDILMASVLTPSLTTLRVDLDGIGRALIDLLLKRIRGKATGDDNLAFDQQLIIRESTP
jgi:LacI family transcriptional regulator